MCAGGWECEGWWCVQEGECVLGLAVKMEFFSLFPLYLCVRAGLSVHAPLNVSYPGRKGSEEDIMTPRTGVTGG